jgi:hypothetical protein
VIAIMATMVLFALFAAQETAKAQKTKTLIAKLDSIIKAKYETYKTRRVNISLPPPPTDTTSADYRTYVRLANQVRLDCLRDLMRMELPDRWSDIEDPPRAFTYTTLFTNIRVPQPSVSAGFYRRWNVTPGPTGEFAGAECLYMIIMAAQAEEGDDRSAIKQDQIGDVDQDGFPEILDAWGMPIKFLRWAPGFQFSELQVVATGNASGSATVTMTGTGLSATAGSYVGGAIMQFRPPVPAASPSPGQPEMFDRDIMARIADYSFAAGSASIPVTTAPAAPFGGRSVIANPDPFDPRGIYRNAIVPTFALYPLIYSAGPNKCYGIMADQSGTVPLRYADPAVNLNPFYFVSEAINAPDPPLSALIGTARNDKAEPNFVPSAWVDNIHNHMITAR